MSGSVEVRLGEPVARVRLADAAGRNVFTPALDSALADAFRRAVAEPATRVVLLAGLADIFSAGGARADLLGEPDGTATIEHDRIIRTPLRCPVPVVAAMRGHAIGGGLLLGLYADVPLLSERSVYSANFLGYGFTPAMGASWLLPYRLGPALGAEVLLGAARHRGAELRDRGVPLRVLPHDEVEPRACELAQRIAEAPRLTLEHAKAALADEWRRASSAAFGRELPGHLETLRLPEVRQRVASQYGVARRMGGAP
ncbi:MAG TPA: polyketide synthase [Streptosporangiaceae bacterium]|nr:polyketide synthase [Streptosporangiaceae bacterium]